jgi:endonuclease YncB( thermonuclease family)
METALILMVLAGVVIFRVMRRVKSRRRHKQHDRYFKASTNKPVSKTLTGAAYIVDGDTITIKKTQIRLFGIDAPELDHPYGKKAKWGLIALCKGKKIRAEITEQDIHGRTVAKCYLPDGRDLSAEMVKQGLAIDCPNFQEGNIETLKHQMLAKKCGWQMHDKKAECMFGKNLKNAITQNEKASA